jgi:hypothetical protein
MFPSSVQARSNRVALQVEVSDATLRRIEATISAALKSKGVRLFVNC